MKLYRGIRITHIETEVYVNDGEEERPLDPRLDLFPHSPGGFNWGYGGSGPSQLALAILVDCCGETTALELYHDFVREKIALIKEPDWIITEEEIYEWLGTKVRKLVKLIDRLKGEKEFWEKNYLELEKELEAKWGE